MSQGGNAFKIAKRIYSTYFSNVLFANVLSLSVNQIFQYISKKKKNSKTFCLKLLISEKKVFNSNKNGMNYVSSRFEKKKNHIKKYLS